MNSERHVAVMHISREMLIERLGLPGDTVLHDVAMEFAFNQGPVLLIIEHASLPITHNGNQMPRVAAIFEKTSADAPAQFKGFE